MLLDLYGYFCFKSEHKWTPKQVDESDIFFLMDLTGRKKPVVEEEKHVFIDQIF